MTKHIETDWLLVGLGRSARSVAAHLQGEKYAVVESSGGLEVWRAQPSSSDWALDRVLESVSLDDNQAFELNASAKVIISPGVDARRKSLRRFSKQEVRELELFKSLYSGKSILVTGTNGKSTFCFQLAKVLRELLCEEDVFLGGNIGTPMFEAVGSQASWAVLEVSSFQAERLSKDLNFEYGVLLSLSPDHLYRYESIEEYYSVKWELLARCNVAIYPQDLKPPSSVDVAASAVLFKSTDSGEKCLRKFLEFFTQKEGLGAVSNIDWQSLPRLPHRMQKYSHPGGWDFIDDSKATNVNSVIYALKQVQRDYSKVLLLLGGRLKGDSFSDLTPLLRAEDEIFVYGEGRDKIFRDLQSAQAQTQTFESLHEVCEKLSREATSQGSCVLLSPGCSSFDEFQDFEDRGRFFVSQMKLIAPIQ